MLTIRGLRPQSTMAVLAVATSLTSVCVPGQHGHGSHHPTPADQTVQPKDHGTVALRDPIGIEPLQALFELSEGARTVVEAQGIRDRFLQFPAPERNNFHAVDALAAAAKPRPRPLGCPRWIAAVVCDAEAGIDIANLFQRSARDLLVLRSPGPIVRSEEIALLERLVDHEALPLCVFVIQKGTRALLRQPEPSAAERVLQRHTAPARLLASRTETSLERAHAEIQARKIFDVSDRLRAHRDNGRFQVAIAVLGENGRFEQWLAPWRTDPIFALRSRLAVEQLHQAQTAGHQDNHHGHHAAEHESEHGSVHGHGANDTHGTGHGHSSSDDHGHESGGAHGSGHDHRREPGSKHGR